MSMLFLFRPRPVFAGEPTDPPPVPGSGAGTFKKRPNRDYYQYIGLASYGEREAGWDAPR